MYIAYLLIYGKMQLAGGAVKLGVRFRGVLIMQIYNRISNCIYGVLLESGQLHEDNKDIYIYLLTKFLGGIGSTLIILLLAIIFHIYYEAFIFTLFFIPLRKSAGGAHLKTRTGCIIFSFAIIGISIFIARWLCDYGFNIVIVIVMLIFAITCIFLFAPVDTKHRRFTVEQKKKCKIVARVIVLIESAIILIGTILLQHLQFEIMIATLSMFVEGAVIFVSGIVLRRNIV